MLVLTVRDNGTGIRNSIIGRTMVRIPTRFLLSAIQSKIHRIYLFWWYNTCYRAPGRWYSLDETTINPKAEQLFQDDEDFEGSGSTEISMYNINLSLLLKSKDILLFEVVFSTCLQFWALRIMLSACSRSWIFIINLLACSRSWSFSVIF